MFYGSDELALIDFIPFLPVCESNPGRPTHGHLIYVLSNYSTLFIRHYWWYGVKLYWDGDNLSCKHTSNLACCTRVNKIEIRWATSGVNLLYPLNSSGDEPCGRAVPWCMLYFMISLQMKCKDDRLLTQPSQCGVFHAVIMLFRRGLCVWPYISMLWNK